MELNGYSNLAKLTKGGMATVYKAHQNSLDRTVAIKFLSAEFLWDEQAIKFFNQESLVIARLNHPNIIHIIDRGVTEKGRPYFVMDYIQGRDLSEVRKQNNLSMNARLELLLQICKGMAFAHKNGVVHRDIKPANILIDDESHVFILDFGIAWLEANGRPESEEILGTPDYMSPEQFNDPKSVSPLSDLYSFGSLMFELFTGQLPAAQFNNLAGCLSSFPQILSELIIKCLKTDPAERPPSADAVAFILLEILNGAHLKQSDKVEAKAAIGKAAEKFALLDVLSKSRFGAVYLFEDKSRENLIVVKKRVNSRAGLKEADKLKKIKHDHLLRVLGTSKSSRAFIVVMEYLAGGNLQDRLSRPYTADRFLKVAIQLCSAMQAAHEQQIMHGNLRPSNILFDDKKQLKITDFGFEKHYNNQIEKSWYQSDHKNLQPVKKDIYSAGAIFYHMLTGVPATLKFGQLQSNSSFDALDDRVQHLIKNMIEIQSVNRFESFAEILPELQKLQQVVKKRAPENKTPAFKLSWFFLILIMLNLLAGIIYYYVNPDFAEYMNSITKQLKFF